jgi:uncharacterized membrane protein required for colicin V production
MDSVMLESILLDILLVLVLTLMISIGAFRGGLREAFSSAGVLLGVLLATEWKVAWGGWLSDNTNLSEGGARFLVGVLLLVLTAGLVGYGVGASFNYHPGPGGRMFGAVLGAATALLAMTYVLTWLRTDLFNGDEPEVVGNTVLARFLDSGSGTVLLVISVSVAFGAIFGSIVREREDDPTDADTIPTFGTRRRVTRSSRDLADKMEPAAPAGHPSAPVRVQHSRQWEDRAGSMPSTADRQWSNTWPSDAPGVPQEERPARQSDVQQARERRRTQHQEGSTPDERRRRSRGRG